MAARKRPMEQRLSKRKKAATLPISISSLPDPEAMGKARTLEYLQTSLGFVQALALAYLKQRGKM